MTRNEAEHNLQLYAEAMERLAMTGHETSFEKDGPGVMNCPVHGDVHFETGVTKSGQIFFFCPLCGKYKPIGSWR